MTITDNCAVGLADENIPCVELDEITINENGLDPAPPCLRQSCQSSGTHRIDLLIDRMDVKISVHVCEFHYCLAQARWEAGLTTPPILHCWFRGLVGK